MILTRHDRFRCTFTVFCLLLSPFSLYAAPFLGNVHKLKQPDGTIISVTLWGDEFYHRTESIDGYTLIKNAQTGWWEYAKLSEDSTGFISTGVVVESKGKNETIGSLPKHCRLPADRESEIYRQNKSALRPARTAEEGNSQLSQASSSSISAQAQNMTGLVVLIDFPDDPSTFSVTTIDNYLNQPGYSNLGNNGSVHDYFYSVSYGKYNYSMVVTPYYYRALHGKEYYDDTVGCDALFQEALDNMNAKGFDLSQVTKDADNRIAAVSYFYANSFGTGSLWAHASWFEYTFSNGVKTGPYMVTYIGAESYQLEMFYFCHETGHLLFNWADLYYRPPSYGTLLDFCIMGTGANARNPVPPNPYFRLLQGWENAEEFSGAASGTHFTVTNASGTIYKYTNPNNTQEFFLIDNCYPLGRFAFEPDAGLFILHVNTEGYPVIALEQADGVLGVEYDDYGGPGDLFHAGYKDLFNGSTVPNSQWSDLSNSSMEIAGVSSIGQSMTFTYNWFTTNRILPPSSLTATAVSSTQINLSWHDNATDESGYYVERASSSSGPWSQIGSTGQNVTNYSNTALMVLTTYWYRVRAYNNSGVSDYSNNASATTLNAAPAEPTGLAATVNSRSQITLNWNDNSTNESGFRIERAPSGGSFSQIATVSANVTSYVNTGLSSGTLYQYRVKAYNSVGTSGPSNVVQATTHANIAVNKTASASTQQSTNTAAKGNDNSTSTRWSASSGSVPQWWKVDLGSSKNLSGSEVYWEKSGVVYKYKIETSPDNATWTVRADRTTNTSTAQTQAQSFNASARYIRITVIGLPSGTWASFWEFRVFGN